MQNLSGFEAHPDIDPWAYNQDVLLKDHRVEKKKLLRAFQFIFL